MATIAEVERLRTANAGLVALLRRELAQFWNSLDLSRPERARDALLAYLPTLTDQYGQLAAVVAADWYDELRANSSATGRFTAIAAAPVAAAAVESRVRFAAGHLFGDNPTATLTFLASAAQRYAINPGRETIARSAARDPGRPRWARVPRGTSTCAFCLALASRGPQYASAATAAGMTHYHDSCDCSATPIWDGDELPRGYDPERLFEQFDAARTAAGSGDLSSVLSTLRTQQGIS